jgi:hypothetical protein
MHYQPATHAHIGTVQQVYKTYLYVTMQVSKSTIIGAQCTHTEMHAEVCNIKALSQAVKRVHRLLTL